MKKIISALLTLTIMFSLCACGATEKEFLNNLYGKELKSYASTGTMEIELTSVVPQEVKDEMSPFNLQSLLNMLSDFKLAWGETTHIDSKDVTSKVTFGVNAPDMSFVTNAYLYTKDGNLIYAFDIPTILKAYLPEEYENSKQVYWDMNELSELSGGEMINYNFAELTNSSLSLQKDLQNFIIDYSKFVPDIKGLVKKSGNTFTITVSDAQLKDIVEDVVTAYMTNEEARKTANEFILKFFEIYKTMYTEEYYNEMFGETETWLNNVSQAEMDIYHIDFKEFMEKFREITVLGDNGINFSYTFSNGYIKNMKCEIDFIADIAAFDETTEYSSEYYVRGLLKINQDVTKVNTVQKHTIIDYKTADAVSLTDWIAKYNEPRYEDYDYTYPDNHISNAQLPASDGSVKIFNNGYEMNLAGFEAKIIDGNLYVPLEQLLDNYYYDYYWNNEMKEMVVSGRNANYYIKSNTNVIYTDNYHILLMKNVISIDGFMYVPLRSFASSVLNKEVYWNSEKRFAGLGGSYYYEYYLTGEY